MMLPQHSLSGHFTNSADKEVIVVSDSDDEVIVVSDSDEVNIDAEQDENVVPDPDEAWL